MATTNPTTYLARFFEEKDLAPRTYEIEAGGCLHLVDSEVVIAAIHGTTGTERRKIEDTLRRIDFANGDVHHFLEHLAGALAARW